MSHTAQQASELWCPMARGIVVGGGAALCIAGNCAMWRWADPAPSLRDEKIWYPADERDSAIERMRKVEPPRPANVGTGAIWVPVTGQLDDDTLDGGYWTEDPVQVRADNERTMAARRGYCGLAGRPEVGNEL